LKIQNCPGSNSWWYSATLVDLPYYYQITSFEMRDSSGNNDDWIAASRYDNNNLCYVFDTGSRPYELPLDFRITANGQTIIGNDVVTSFDDSYQGDMAQNFQTLNSDNSFKTGDDSNGNKNKLNWIEITIIAVSVLSLICIIAGFVYYFKKRGSNKNDFDKQSIAMVQHQDGGHMTTPVNDDDDSIEAPNEQTNIMAVDDYDV